MLRSLAGCRSRSNGDKVRIDYCTGQYWPTEYRPAVCRLLSSVIWHWIRQCINVESLCVVGKVMRESGRLHSQNRAVNLALDRSEVVQMKTMTCSGSPPCSRMRSTMPIMREPSQRPKRRLFALHPETRDTVHTVLRHVSRSGMMRDQRNRPQFAISHGTSCMCSGIVARKNRGLRALRLRYGHGFHVVYNLGMRSGLGAPRYA